MPPNFLQIKRSFLSISIGLHLFVQYVTASQQETQLFKDLGIPERYNTLVRPAPSPTQPLDLVLGLTMQQIIDVDEKNQVIKTNIWLNMKWTDHYLIWNKNEYGGIDVIRVPPKYLWTPDILLYNSVTDSFNSFFQTNIVVQSDGKVDWLPPGIVVSTCKIDIRWFPFDEQKCTLKFGSWTYSGLFINLTNGEVDKSTYTPNGEWQLVDVLSERHEFKYECCPDPYYDVTFTIWIRRRTLYYGFNLIIPCLLISLMTLLVFILPPDSGEKLTLGITIFMSLCVFLLMVAEAMPPTSEAVPLIGVYFSSIMIICALSQVFTVLVLNMHHRNPKTHKMPQIMRSIFLNWLPWILWMTRPGYKVQRCKLVADENDIEKDSREKSTNINQPPQINNIVYWEDNVLKRIKALQSEHALNEMPPCVSEGLSNLEIVVHEILKELKIITNKLTNDEEDDEIVRDWKFSAMVMDRLCLLVFTSILTFSTCAIIFAAPNLVA